MLSKTINLSVFQAQGKINDFFEKINAKKAGKIDSLPKEPGAENIGWVSAVDPLDCNFSEEDITFAFYKVLYIRIAKNRINRSVLAAMVKSRCRKYMQNTGFDFVPKKELQEIKEDAENTLAAKTIPSIRNIYVAFLDDGRVITGAASNKEISIVADFLFQTFGVPFEKTSPSIEEENQGKSFFRYLLMKSKKQEFPTYTVLPPYTFIAKGEQEPPCTKATALGLMASESPEVLASLKDGKELAKIKIAMTGDAVIGGESKDIWTFTIKQNFTLSSVKTPEGAEMGYAERIVEKIDFLLKAISFLTGNIKEFLADKENNEKAIEKWINEK